MSEINAFELMAKSNNSSASAHGQQKQQPSFIMPLIHYCFYFPPAFVVAAASLSPLFVINFRLCVAAANLGEKLK